MELRKWDGLDARNFPIRIPSKNIARAQWKFASHLRQALISTSKKLGVALIAWPAPQETRGVRFVLKRIPVRVLCETPEQRFPVLGVHDFLECALLHTSQELLKKFLPIQLYVARIRMVTDQAEFSVY